MALSTVASWADMANANDEDATVAVAVFLAQE
jgi:hypothetical protein